MFPEKNSLELNLVIAIQLIGHHVVCIDLYFVHFRFF